MRKAAVCIALLMLTAMIYARTSANGFINYDDPEYVSKNPVVQQGLTWQGAGWALTATENANWHPLTWWSHLLDVSLFGVRPGPQHLVSAALHAISALLLFLALDGLTGVVWPSAMVAALFAAHPLQVESVAWIAQRKSVLCGLLLIIGLHAYVRYVRRPGRARSAVLIAVFSLALMAKPIAVVFPLWLLLLDWWPLGRITGWTPGFSLRLKEKLPLFALSLAVGVITLFTQLKGQAVKSLVSYPLSVRLENGLHALAVYPLKFLWPTNLAVFYPHPGAGLPGWQWLGAGLLLTAVAADAWMRRRTRPWLVVGWSWYFVTLLPVIGIVQVGEQAMADRYAYLPSVGLGFVLAWSAAAAVRRAGAVRAALPAAAVAAIVVSALLAREQAGRWRDSETLFRYSLAVAGESSLIRANLGGALSEEGRWQEGLREDYLALSDNPNDTQAWFNAGVACGTLERWGDAETAFRKVVELDPSDREARYNLGILAVRRGDVKTAREQRDALDALDKHFAEKLGLALADLETVAR